MKKKEEYRKYLNSEQWKLNRNYALNRTSGYCQYCGAIATQVHHAIYPKQLGKEHPNSLIPVCKRCHDISHGVQEMKQLHDVTRMTDLSPEGVKLNYLLSGGRVYASAKSWARALRIPDSEFTWFESGLSRTAMLKNDIAGGELEMSYMNTPVYRWHAVADQLRAFDRQWYKNQFSNRPKNEQRKLKEFHENYERIVSWGYDLQERALSSLVNAAQERSAPVTQDTLLEAIKDAVAPRLREHDGKLNEHDVVITEIKNAVPSLRDPEEYISIKQAVSEQGLDGNSMPLYPKSKDNLTGLSGQLLANKNVEKGPKIIARIDGQSFSTPMNTYRRREIYKVLEEIAENSQLGLNLDD